MNESYKKNTITQTDVKDAKSIQSKVEDSTGSTTSRKRGIDDEYGRKVVQIPPPILAISNLQYHLVVWALLLDVRRGSLGLLSKKSIQHVRSKTKFQ